MTRWFEVLPAWIAHNPLTAITVLGGVAAIAFAAWLLSRPEPTNSAPERPANPHPGRGCDTDVAEILKGE